MTRNEKAADSLAGHIDGKTHSNNQVKEGASIMTSIQHRREIRTIDKTVARNIRGVLFSTEPRIVAAILDVSAFTAWRILTGRKSPTIGQLHRLAISCGMSLTYFLSLVNDETAAI